MLTLFAQDQQQGPVVLVLFVALLLLLVMALFVGLIFFLVGRHWLAAFMAGVPISLLSVVGMVLRRANVKKVVRQGIACSQAGYPIPWDELMQLDEDGFDLDAIGEAHLSARKNGKVLSLDELKKATKAGKH